MSRMVYWTRCFIRFAMRSLCIFKLNKITSTKWVPNVQRTQCNGWLLAVFSVLASETSSSVDDSPGEQTLYSSLVHAILDYCRNSIAIVWADCYHYLLILIFKANHLLVTGRIVEANDKHWRYFVHSFYCGYCVEWNWFHYNRSARWFACKKNKKYVMHIVDQGLWTQYPYYELFGFEQQQSLEEINIFSFSIVAIGLQIKSEVCHWQAQREDFLQQDMGLFKWTFLAFATVVPWAGYGVCKYYICWKLLFHYQMEDRWLTHNAHKYFLECIVHAKQLETLKTIITNAMMKSSEINVNANTEKRNLPKLR